jgi:hypothetical protein
MILPSEPGGNTAEAGWMRKLRLFVASLVILPGIGYKVRRSPNGTILEILPGAGGSPGNAGMVFRGEYSTTVSYIPQDVVVLRSGPSAGAYVCVKENSGGTQPPTLPDTGIYWVSIGRSDTVGTWL